MKKLFSTLLLVFFFTSFQAFADGEFTTRQLALRSEIQSFLKQEGFMPEIDSDGDIKFKREGNTYYIRIDKANKSPMYLRLQSYYNYSDNLSKSKISAALPDLNLWKAVKVVMYESQFTVQADMFLTSSEAFKTVFYKLISIVSDLEDEVLKL